MRATTLAGTATHPSSATSRTVGVVTITEGSERWWAWQDSICDFADRCGCRPQWRAPTARSSTSTIEPTALTPAVTRPPAHPSLPGTFFTLQPLIGTEMRSSVATVS